MGVTKNFQSSSLDLNGVITISQPTALVWGPDGRLYVTEVDGDVKVLSIAFGDPNPDDADATARFYVTEAATLTAVKQIQNYNDDGTVASSSERQVTGIDVTPQYDDEGNAVLIDGEPAVTVYVTSSDSRIGAGPGGDDANLDTNSGVITKLTQTGPDSWAVVDLVRGLPRSEENHAVNGLEVIQEVDAEGKLVSERMIVAAGGNANAGAPSNNFAGQQEQPLSAALLEVDLDAIAALDTQIDDDGRAYVYDLPTLNDPTRGANGENDPFGGNDGLNSAKLLSDGPIQLYSTGYRNAFDVEVTEDGRVYTYDNGANNSWGGRPIGEAGDNGKSIDFAQAAGYISTNLNNGEGNGNDPINLEDWAPSNKDQLHEATRSDDLDGRTLSAGAGGAKTYLDPNGSGLTLVYGGHPNPTRAEGSRAGLLFSPKAGAEDSFLLVSDQDSFGNGGGSDYDEVVAWLAEVEQDDAAFPTDGIYGAEAGELTSRVLAVTPGVTYDIYRLADGSGQAVPAGGQKPAGGTFLGQAGLPSDIADIVAYVNPIEGDYYEAARTDGAIDSGNGSINGLAEYTSTVFDGGGIDMSGALFAASLGGSIIVIGRENDGTVNTKVNGKGFTLAADRTVIDAGGAPLGLASLGDDYEERGLTKAFQGSVWSAVYKQNGPFIEIFQPKAGGVPLAGSEASSPTDADLDGLDHIEDPFEFSAQNGYALAVGDKLTLDFSPLNDEFPTSFSSTGLLGAALDGSTPNRDAFTDAENFPADQQRDGLFDNGGNLIPGGNAPIFQIKEVADGTMVGAANSARDAMQTGFRPGPEVQRVVAVMDAKNWLPAVGTPATGQVSGLFFGDGTQSNFVRVVFGGVEGFAAGLEVGVETGDAYTVLGRIGLPELLAPDAPSSVELRLEVADIGGGFDLDVGYRLEGQSGFTSVPLDGGAGFSLPAGVLRDVLTGGRTLGTGADEQVVGAAVGLVAEDVPGGDLAAIDFNQITVEAFGNEILAKTAGQVGQSGTAGEDTVIYTGTATNLAPLANNVENFDGTRSSANYDVTGNALDNVIRVGTGQNEIVTGAGEDVVRGTLEQLAGDAILDFSTLDAVIVEGVDADEVSIGFTPGSAGIVIDGQEIVFDGPLLQNFDPNDGFGTFRFTNVEGGMRITLAPEEEVLYRVNAGSDKASAGQGTIAATDDGPDWIGDASLKDPAGPVVLTGNTANSFTSASTSQQSDVTYTDGVDAGEVPWQLFVNERGDNQPGGQNLKYQFDVEVGETYRIDLFYTENWDGVFAFAEVNGGSREFDVSVEGVVPAAFDDLNPAAEAAEALGVVLPAGTASQAEKDAILGTALVASHTYTAEDGTLNLDFLHQVQNPKINAIQVTQLGGRTGDTGAPVIVSIDVENPQGVQDDARQATIVLRDDQGFEKATLEALDGSELSFTGIVPSEVSNPAVTLSEGGLVATLDYSLTPPAAGWPRGEGTLIVAPGAYTDAAGNPAAGAQGAFIFEPNLSGLERGGVALAINVGPETAGTDPDLVGADKSTYGGAIGNDPIIGVPLAADDDAYYEPATAPVVDGAPGGNGTSGALDGSALHTARDGSFVARYPVENGVYVVDLWVAELDAGAAGQAQGDYLVNGETVALDLDAYAQEGADGPVKISKTVVVTGGELVVDVKADLGAPALNAVVAYEAVPPTGTTTVSVSSATAIEGQDAVIVLTRTGDATQAVDVTLAVNPGTADPSDYSVPLDTTVTIPAGERQATFAVPIVNDAQEEVAESFTVSISNLSGGAQVGTGTGLVTIGASDVSSDLPLGGPIFDLGFDASGAPIGEGGFDAVLGGPGALEPGKANVAGGKLVVSTSQGDLGNADPTASKNDFVREADISSGTVQQVYLSTRFDNPFDAEFLTSRGYGDTVPNFLQQGVVVATGDPSSNQQPGEVVKLVWGGIDGNGIQLYSQGSFGPVKTIEQISEEAVLAGKPAFGIGDVASVELALGLNKASGTIEAWATLFDDQGTILGGIRPDFTPGFDTMAPQTLPPAVAAAVADGTSVFGVTSSDFDPEDDDPAFTATWDRLTLSSPQVGGEGSGDAFQGIDTGDYSDDPAQPSDLGTLPLGEAVLVTTQEGPSGGAPRDYDYVTFTVAEGQQLDSLVVSDYESTAPSNGGFIGLVQGTDFPAPPASQAENAAVAAQLLVGAVVPNTTAIGSDLFGPDGDGSVQGEDTLDHDGPLGAGTYTLWFSQSGAQSTTTLTFETSPASGSPVVSIANAGSVVEGGDTGSTLLQFPLTATGGLDGTAQVSFTVDGAASTQQVAFANGQGTLAVSVPNDDADTGPTSVEVALTAVQGAEVAPGASSATGTVTEDDDGGSTGGGGVVFALNVGGPQVTGADGTVYEADDGSGWSGFSRTYTDGAASADQALPGGDYDRDGVTDGDDTPYATDRYGGKGSGVLTYTRGGLEPGDYTLTLKFAEIFDPAFGPARDRVFDVRVNGETVLDDLDLDDVTTSADEGYDVDVPVTVGANGTLSVAFDASVDNAKVNAMVLRGEGSGGGGNTPPATTPIDAGSTPETGAPVQIDLLQGASDADGDPLSVTGVAVTSGGAAVPFALDGATVTIDPADLADGVGPGETATVSITYGVSDGRGGTTPGSATLDVTGVGGPGGETPLSLGAVSSYGLNAPQDQDAGTAQVSGSDVTLLGNAWKSVALGEPIVAVEGMELRFDYTAPSKISEIVAIGLDDDGQASNGGAVFQIAGTQNFRQVDQSFRDYDAPGTTQSFAIDLSAFAGQTFDRLVLIHDQDQQPATSEGAFTSIRIATPGGTSNAAPVAGDDSGAAREGEVVAFPIADLLGNDTDADGDPLQITGVSNAQGGSVELAGGEVRFTAGAPGAASFDYTVSDGQGGTDTGTVSVTITEAPTGGDGVAIDFSAAPITSYDTQDSDPGSGAAVEQGGDAVRITGNAWKKIALPDGATVGPDSVLRFDLTLNGSAGEILGIGLETDDRFSTDGDALFQLAGSQNFGKFSSREAFGQTGAVGETVSYEIDLGSFAGTDFTHLVLIADADKGPAIDATFSGVEIGAPGTGGGGGGGGGGTPGTPPRASQVFDAQDDLATGASYGGGAVGAAELRVTAGSQSIDVSNFAPNSFQVTNVGDKTISAVFIDVTDALYPDSVFDPDGAGGDDVAKAWAVNSGGGTGGFVDGSGYFLPGPDPLPNTTGTGQASDGGFKGALVKFSPTASGGFQPGETVGFSGDMDPNSIAGLLKSDVDQGATSSWDVGGISGHEIIGSAFTVLFDDGSTATGELMSDGSASGSFTRATQGAQADAPGLSVAGGSGTYGGTAPGVIVTGEPGQTVRVTLTKGLDPVTNGSNGIDALVDARLDRYDFEVSNNFDSQSVEVTLGASGTADLTDRFDYADAPANSKPGFAGDDVAPIGFVAAVVGADGLPISPVTEPVYLTNQGGPVGGGVEGTFAAVFPVQASSDDYEVDRGRAGSNDLEFGVNRGTDMSVGLRFDDVTVPQGRTIERAFLRFEADGTASEQTSLVVEIEDTTAAATYSDADTPDDRSYADDFLWSNVEAWTEGQTYESPDLAALVSQVVGGGVEDGSLAFRITGAPGNTGGRAAESFDATGAAPELVIVLSGEDPI